MFIIDILLLIPRLIWEIVLAIWSVIKFIGRAAEAFFGELMPYGSNASWLPFISVVGIIILSFILRKNFGGFFKALGSVLAALLVLFVMYNISPLFMVVNLLVAILIGLGIIKGKGGELAYMAIGIIWLILIFLKIAR